MFTNYQSLPCQLKTIFVERASKYYNGKKYNLSKKRRKKATNGLF